jgi:hypothetical protein
MEMTNLSVDSRRCENRQFPGGFQISQTTGTSIGIGIGINIGNASPLSFDKWLKWRKEPWEKIEWPGIDYNFKFKC